MFDLLEDEASADAINESFVRTGLAYEARNTRTGTQIDLYDPVGAELGVDSIPSIAAMSFGDRFDQPSIEWDRALKEAGKRDPEATQIIKHAIGALEGVVHILSNKPGFAAGIDSLFHRTDPWQKAMASSLKSLYGYASQAPGVRHAQWTEPNVQMSEAMLVLRVCGSAVAFLASEDRFSK